MNRIVLSFLVLTFLFFSLAVHGQLTKQTTSQPPPPSKNVVVSDIHGSDLLHSCNMQIGTTGMQFCEAFIVGVRDGVVLAAQLRGTEPIIDTPVEAKQAQLIAAVVKYLNDHPEEHHKPAALLVIVALSQAFPPRDKTAG
jgi:hypothetical protein